MKLSEDDISKLSSNSICELIIFYRNFSKDSESISILMKELSKRRFSGDSFDFESKLKEISKEINDLKNKVIFSEDQI